MPTKFCGNALARNWPSSRRSARCRNSTAKTGPFAAPCRFGKLLAETGVAESDLRAVLDLFRAPNCSFLVPPPTVAPTLAPDDRVDIGHEALLRRWTKLSGDALAQESAPAKAVIGWLAEEQADGQRYRTLASLLDEEKASLTEPQKTKRWWDSRPRTAAWADRYGGRFRGCQNPYRR